MHFLRKVQEFHLHRGTHRFVIYNRKLNFNFLKDTASDWESRVFSFAIFFLIGRGFLYIFFHFVGLCPYLYKYFIRKRQGRNLLCF